MAKTFDVETTDKIYTVQADSEEEARALVNAQLGQPQDVIDEEQNPDQSQELTPTGLQKFGQTVEETLTTPVVGDQSISQIATTPQRGFRGIGVGAQKAIEGVPLANFSPFGALTPENLAVIAQNIPGAVDRASEAVQPGFQPEEGERLGAAVGEAVGGLPLATALTPALPGAGAAKVAVQMLAGAGGGAAFQAINDASERGEIDPTDIVFSSAINGIFPIVRPTVQSLAKFIRASTEIPISGTTTLSREAMGELADDPKLLEKAEGTARSIGNKVENLQRKMTGQLTKIGERLKSARLRFGITSPLETPVEQVAVEGLPQKDFRQIAKEFVDLKNGTRTIEEGGNELLGTVGKKTTIKNIPIKQRIKELYELRYQIDQNNVVKKKVGAEVQPIAKQDVEDRYLRNLRTQINDKLDELTSKVNGGAALRLMDRAYSQSRSLYDEFLKKLSDPAKAEQTLLSIYRKGNPDEIIGLNADTVDVIRRLERKTGEQYLKPLRQEIAAREFKNIKGRGGQGLLNLAATPVSSVLETLGTQGTSTGLNAMYGLTSIMKRLGDIAASRAGRATTLSLTPLLLRGENK